MFRSPHYFCVAFRALAAWVFTAGALPAVLLVLSTSYAALAPAQTETSALAKAAPKNILLLYSYGHGSKGIGVFDEGLLSALTAGGVGTNNLFFEYLDLERNNTDREHRELLKGELLRRYGRHRIDLILTIQQPALGFLLNEGKELAPGMPAIFVQAPLPTMQDVGNRRVVGLVASFDIRGTLERALELFPDTRRVLFVSGSSEADKRMALAAGKVASAWAGKVEFENTTELSLDQMMKRVGNLPPHSIIIFTQYNRDTTGRVTVAYEVEGMIVKAANAPVFGLYDFNLRNGGIGGSVVGVKDLGERTGRLALEILDGKVTLQQGVTSFDVKVIPMFDWDQIKRWGGDPERLRDDSIFVNRMPTFWEQYRLYVVGLTVFLLAQTLLITALLVSRRRSKLAELSLQESEQDLAITLQSIGDAVIATDPTGRVTRMNATAERLSGWTLSDAMGRPLSEVFRIVNADTREPVADPVQLVTAHSQVVGLANHTVLLARDGHEYQIADSAAPICNAAGEIVGVVLVFSDVTGQYRAQKMLQASEYLYRTMIDSAPEGVWMIGSDRRTTEVNQRMCDLLGYAREDMLGRNPVAFADEENGRVFEQQAQRAPSRQTRTYEVSLRHCDGHNVPTEFSATTLFDEGGSVLGVLAFVVELTERKQAEEQLKHLSQRLLLATSSARLGVWDWNVRENTMVWDDRMFELYGITREASSHSIEAWMNGLHPEDKETAIAECQAALNGEKEFDTAFRVLHPDGTVKYLKANGLVLRGADGLAERMIGINADITEGTQAEIQHTQLETQLRESQKMEALGTMAGGVAHDFNNALALIIGNVELARQDVGPGHAALVSLEEIGKASRRAKDLVQQILAFGRRQKLERKPMSLALVLVETARLVRATLPAMVSLSVNCEPDAPAVLADATQIKQILLNLCGNAIQAIQDQGRLGKVEIDLRAHVQSGAIASSNLKEGRYACLTVRDTGPGMDEATRSHIFEPFFTTKPVGKGTGLGLAVVHGIVQSHEAAIEVESEPGKGSALRIYFPAIDAQVEEVAQPDAVATQIDGAGKRVLYIDDEEAIIFLMQRLLERQGFCVSGFTNPQEALAAVQANPGEFDLAVTDFNMPGMSGLEVASALREIRSDLPVVLASGYITEELRQMAPGAGVRELIYKPNTVDDLCSAVARYANAQIKVAS